MLSYLCAVQGSFRPPYARPIFARMLPWHSYIHTSLRLKALVDGECDMKGRVGSTLPFQRTIPRVSAKALHCRACGSVFSLGFWGDQAFETTRPHPSAVDTLMADARPPTWPISIRVIPPPSY